MNSFLWLLKCPSDRYDSNADIFNFYFIGGNLEMVTRVSRRQKMVEVNLEGS